jgi:hypothetical protein
LVLVSTVFGIMSIRLVLLSSSDFPKDLAKQVNLIDLSGGLTLMPKLVYENNRLLNLKNSVWVYTWGCGLFIGGMMCTLTARVSLSTSK